MSDDSLFSKHLRLMEADEKDWTDAERAEFARLKDLSLPELHLRQPVEENSILERGHQALLNGLKWWTSTSRAFRGGLQFATLTLVVGLSIWSFRHQDHASDRLTPKGALQVSVFWERDGKVSPLLAESQLKDGDKVGATLLSSEESVAYWAITDHEHAILSDLADVEASRIDLQPGVRKSFSSSFELVAPNQGENLVIVVCPIGNRVAKADAAPLFDQKFVAKLMTESRVPMNQCVFVGSRLRRLK